MSDLPCICVAPSVEQCILGIAYWADTSSWSVYETYDVYDESVPADWVYDHSVTRERRFFQPQLFTRVGTLRTSVLDSIDPHFSSDDFDEATYMQVLTAIAAIPEVAAFA